MNHLFSHYVSPDHEAEAVRVLSESPDAIVVAGGTVALATDQRPPGVRDTVLDLTNAGMADIAEDDTRVVVGAMVTYRQLLTSPVLAERVPLLTRMAAGITGGPQIRNRGTIGGSACNANPASDVPTALVALDSVLRIEGPHGSRLVEAAAFFRGAFVTALEPGEILTEIHLPHPRDSTPVGYHKIKMAEGSWPLATAAVVELPGRTRLTLGAVTPKPVSGELAMPLGEVTRADLDDLATSMVASVGGWSDELASAAYRARIAPVAAWRAFTTARGQETDEDRTRSDA